MRWRPDHAPASDQGLEALATLIGMPGGRLVRIDQPGGTTPADDASPPHPAAGPADGTVPPAAEVPPLPGPALADGASTILAAFTADAVPAWAMEPLPGGLPGAALSEAKANGPWQAAAVDPVAAPGQPSTMPVADPVARPGMATPMAAAPIATPDPAAGPAHHASGIGMPIDSASASVAPAAAPAVAADPGHDHGGGHGDPAKDAEHETFLALAALTDNPPAGSGGRFVAIADGAWSDPATWADGRIPDVADGFVVIPAGVTVTYDLVSDTRLAMVRVDGHLSFATDQDTRLVVDTLIVNTMGELSIGSHDVAVAADAKAEVIFADSRFIDRLDRIAGDIDNDATQLSLGLVSHGTAHIHGAEKAAHLEVAETPLAGQTSLLLAGPPEGWQVGDTILLTGTRLVPRGTGPLDPTDPDAWATQDETFTITAIEGNRVTLDHALQFDHDTPHPDFAASVANLSRNVEFRSAAPDTIETRGHVMFMHSDHVMVENAAFIGLGRTDKSRDLDDFVMADPLRSETALDDRALVGNEYVKTDAADVTNARGRYALHLHRLGTEPGSNPAEISGNVVIGSPGWGIVHHDSAADLADNVVYGVFGAGIVAETGNETGLWANNLVANIPGRSLNGVEDIAIENAQSSNHDFGATGVGFWFQGRAIEATGNTAANTGGSGFFYRANGVDDIAFATDNLDDPELAWGQPTIQNRKVPIRVFTGNESYASEDGLTIIGAEMPRMNHDGRSVIDGFSAWEFDNNGIRLRYTTHYTMTNLVLIGAEAPTSDPRIGISIGVSTQDTVVTDSYISQVTTGILTVDSLTHTSQELLWGAEDQPRNAAIDDFGHAFVDVTFDPGVRQPFRFNPVPGRAEPISYPNIDGATLDPNARLSLQLQDSSLFASWGGTATTPARSATIQGTKTDGLGTVAFPFGEERILLDEALITRHLETFGYYTAGTRRVILVDTVYSDRLTGEMKVLTHSIQLDAAWELPPGAHDLGALPNFTTAVRFDLVALTGPDGHTTLQPVPVANEVYLAAGLRNAAAPATTLTFGTFLDEVMTAAAGGAQLAAAAGADTLAGRQGRDTLFGGDGADSITGGVEADRLFGNAGDDLVVGDEGADTLGGDAGMDILRGGIGADSLNGGEDADTLDGEADGDSLDGAGGGDLLRGGAGNDTLLGGHDADTLDGAAGNDRLDGGDGNDTARFAAAANASLATGQATGQAIGNDTLVGIETIEGSDFADTLAGDALGNALLGGGGADLLEGAGGSDTISGGDGNDRMEGGEGNDRLEGGAGLDTARYAAAGAGVAISLALAGINQNTRAAGLDVLVDIEAIEGSAFADTLTGAAAAETLDGASGDDLIDGGAAGDSLQGGAGADTLTGGAGDDLVAGGTGLDTARYAAAAAGVAAALDATGAGTASGGDGLDTLTGIEAIEGSAFADTLASRGGAGGSHTLSGGAGDDRVEDQGGNDRLEGGSGTDLLSYAGVAAGITVNLLTRTAQATGGGGTDTLLDFEDLEATAFADTITGGTGANRLLGGAGHDSLTGNAGDDTLEGGDGDDQLHGGAGNDFFLGGAGFDTVSFLGILSGVTVSLALAATVDQNTGGAGISRFGGIEAVIGTGFNDRFTAGSLAASRLDGATGNDSLAGGALGDTLLGGAGADTLDGAGGADNVDGGAGSDLLRGGLGNDTIASGADADTLEGGDGADSLDGAGAADLLRGGTGNDTLLGDTEADTLDGGEGADSLAGGGGADSISGSDGDDEINGGAANDSMVGGAGFDTLSYADATAAVKVSLAILLTQATGGAGTDLLSGFEALVGSAYGDTLTGDAVGNRIDGGAGGDSLIGGAGNDTLVAGAGSDSLAGDSGADIFLFAPGTGTDRIRDFAAGDRLSFEGFGPAYDTAAEILATAREVGTPTARDTELRLPNPGSATTTVVILEGVRLASLDASDFGVISA